MLRDYIREVIISEGKKKIKKESGKYATILANSTDDMSLILAWLRGNKAIRSAGQVRKSGNSYIVKVRVNPKFGRTGVFNLVKDKFGMFARVR